ncbi:hypothetical protein TNCV_92141 [Trichonephila clavipes]|nr:hypothetical protein TNCV_92141 [Trichonephila clavipes]
MDSLSGIRLGDNKRENLENGSEQDVTLEESSKESIGQRLARCDDDDGILKCYSSYSNGRTHMEFDLQVCQNMYR